ncbi:MAG: prepilin peptidase [Coriobacteriia bacterium]|nr:prepilin peptidase [Coriobacteriia bacterium]
MSVLSGWLFALLMGVFGLVFGSFANVVIWRVPRGESIVGPGSHCPACDAPIAWYDNIPVLSWVVLRGECRACHTSIAIRYPLVELASGGLFVLAAVMFGFGLQAVVGGVLFWFLLVLSVIDLDHMRLPNLLVAMLAAGGLVAMFVSEFTEVTLVPLVPLPVSGPLASSLAYGFLGVLLGAGAPAFAAGLYGLIRGKRGLGMGDVKLLSVLGLYFGPYVLLVLFVGSLIGMVMGLVTARDGKISESRIPFGPWLAVGAVVVTLIGPFLWGWYAQCVGLN